MQFLRQVADCVGHGGKLLIGVDLKKDSAILDMAYNDAAGVTAAFNLNLLQRIQDELDAELEISAFNHRAFYNAAQSRVEMHLVSACRQTIALDDEVFELAAEESIHTESSYKYHLDEFAQLARRAGFSVEQVWTDAGRCSVCSCSSWLSGFGLVPCSLTARISLLFAIAAALPGSGERLFSDIANAGLPVW